MIYYRDDVYYRFDCMAFIQSLWVSELGSLTIHTNLSPIRRGLVPGFVNYKNGCTRLTATSEKVYQLFAHGQWFSLGIPASSTTKSGVKHQKSIDHSLESGNKICLSSSIWRLLVLNTRFTFVWSYTRVHCGHDRIVVGFTILRFLHP